MEQDTRHICRSEDEHTTHLKEQSGLSDAARVHNTASPVSAEATVTTTQQFPPSMAAPAPVVESPPSQGRFKAIYDFQAQSNGELGVKTGDLVLVVQKEDNGWWSVRQPQSGSSGWVPAAYLVEAKEAPPPPPPRQESFTPASVIETYHPHNQPNEAPFPAPAEPDLDGAIDATPTQAQYQLVDTDEREQWHDADAVPAPQPLPASPSIVADTPAPGPGRYAERNTIQLPVRQPSSTYRPERGPPVTTSSTNETIPRVPHLALNVSDADRERMPGRSGTKLDIRDTSRSRGTPQPVRAPTGEVCDSCEEICLQTSYCNVCRLLFCQPCWA